MSSFNRPQKAFAVLISVLTPYFYFVFCLFKRRICKLFIIILYKIWNWIIENAHPIFKGK